MSDSELAEIRRRADIAQARVGSALEANLYALHHRNAAALRLKSGGTVKEAASIVLSAVADYFAELEAFIKSRPDSRKPGFDANVVDAVSTSTAELLNSINRGMLKSATLAGNPELVHVVQPEIDLGMTRAQETFRSNIRAHWASRAAVDSLTGQERLLLGFEILGLVASSILVGMWIANPNGGYEPYLALSGLATLAADITRRVLKRRA
jgi:hypothetical protein